jgi:hypothetical protein
MGCLQRRSATRSSPLVPIVFLALLGVLISRAGSAQGVCDPSLPGCVDPRGFLVRAYAGQIVKNGGKCLDYTPGVIGSPIFLNDCSRAHAVSVSQTSQRTGADGYARKYEVLLRAGNAVIGPRILAPGQVPGAEVQLELQQEGFRGRLFGPRILNDQTFVLDGDSIILASDRDRIVVATDPYNAQLAAQVRVFKVQNSRGANGSPIVLGERQLTDSEFWEFHAIDGSGREPTCNDFVGDQSCAFVHVSGLGGLGAYLNGSNNAPETKWPDYDKVIVVDSGPIILSEDELSPMTSMSTSEVPTLLVTAGVTIRGDRRGANLGPELAADLFQIVFFETKGNDVRISGLRIRGGNTSRNTGLELYESAGILLNERVRNDDGSYLQYSRVVIDHNDMSDWTWRAVYTYGGDPASLDYCYEYPPQPQIRPNYVRVARNFLHHNLVQNKGYGVNANSGAFPLVDGNVFVTNRHAIAATNTTPYTGYRAWSNLVLDDVPLQFAPGGIPFYTHDFDIHGTGHNGFCGLGGGYTEVAGNTFLGTGAEVFGIGLSRTNFEVRGVPCQGVNFHDNVSLQSKDDTIELTSFYYDPPLSTCVQTIDNVQIAPYPNQFDYSNPTNRFGVGDFDGDGRQDLFLATRTAFYYSPGGEAEWRLLSSGRTDRIEGLLFGDFDGDGRTDVIGKNGGNINVSWGSASEWERLNTIYVPISELAVGNFDGLGGDDIFWATGRAWYVSAGGSGPFQPVNTSSFRVRDLRFGDFNGNGKTDVLGVVAGNWMFSDGATTGWTSLRTPRLTDTVNDLFIGDFNGDGRDDVGHFDDGLLSDTYEYWPTPAVLPGGGGFTELVSTRRDRAAAGHFLGGAQSQLLFWDDEKLDIVFVGSGGFVNYSRQDMK